MHVCKDSQKLKKKKMLLQMARDIGENKWISGDHLRQAILQEQLLAVLRFKGVACNAMQCVNAHAG